MNYILPNPRPRQQASAPHWLGQTTRELTVVSLALRGRADAGRLVPPGARLPDIVDEIRLRELPVLAVAA